MIKSRGPKSLRPKSLRPKSLRPKSRGHKYSNSKRNRKSNRISRVEQPTHNHIVPTNLPPVEENEPNNGRLTAEQRNSVHEYIKYLMEMEKSGIKPTRSQPTEEDLKKDKESLLEKIGMEMWNEQNKRIPPLDDYFNKNEDNYRHSPNPSPNPSPGPSPSPSPSPSPTERPESTTPKDEPPQHLFGDLHLPGIRGDKTPPISGGKSRRIFRRKNSSRRRLRRSTRSEHKH